MTAVEKIKARNDKRAARYPYIDILNICAILAVLFLHHNFSATNFAWNTSWIFGVVTKAVFRFAIPVFIMITGAMLLGYREKYDTKTFFKKRFAKILIPAICWITIMFLWRLFIIKDPAFSDLSFANIIKIIANSLEDEHYWYIFAIIGIYLTIPILSFIAKKENKRAVQYAIAAMFVFNSLLPLSFQLFDLSWNPFLHVNLSNYLIFLLIGYYIHTFPIAKKRRVAIYAVAIAVFVTGFVATLFLSNERGAFIDSIVGENTSPFAIIYASALFVFVRNINFARARASALKLLSVLASCSFGVYLTHKLVMHYTYGLLQKTAGLNTSSWGFKFLCPFLTYALCICLVLILKKIPLIRKAVP